MGGCAPKGAAQEIEETGESQHRYSAGNPDQHVTGAVQGQGVALAAHSDDSNDNGHYDRQAQQGDQQVLGKAVLAKHPLKQLDG